jgi:bacterioferritin-associated ferredoxin
MYVCVCNGVTDHAIRDAAAEGVTPLSELTRRTGCGDCCGSCVDLACDILDTELRSRPLDLPLACAA